MHLCVVGPDARAAQLQHGIGGASWYERDREELHYYGDDFWVIAREGFGNFLADFLEKLNGDRLRMPTIFQRVERAGLRATCINYLIFKGDVAHHANTPELLRLLDLPEFVRSALLRGDITMGHARAVATSEDPEALTNEIVAKGLTPNQVEQKLVDGLKQGYLVDPKVSLSQIEYRPFYINGEVQKPGSYPFQPGLTLDY